MDFNKYCNCYNMPYGKIEVECYDTVLEAIHKYETRKNDTSFDSKLVIMNKFWPQVIQKIIVQNALSKPVVILPNNS